MAQSCGMVKDAAVHNTFITDSLKGQSWMILQSTQMRLTAKWSSDTSDREGGGLGWSDAFKNLTLWIFLVVGTSGACYAAVLLLGSFRDYCGMKAN